MNMISATCDPHLLCIQISLALHLHEFVISLFACALEEINIMWAKEFLREERKKIGNKLQ